MPSIEFSKVTELVLCRYHHLTCALITQFSDYVFFAQQITEFSAGKETTFSKMRLTRISSDQRETDFDTYSV